MVIKGDIRIFPDEVKELLQGLAAEKFFADGILCGSWVKLGAIVDSQRFSKATRADILKSATHIGYPPFL